MYNILYQLVQIQNIFTLFFLFACILQICPAVLVFCPYKMRLKYIKDICIFNYEPAAILLCMFGLCVFCVMTAC